MGRPFALWGFSLYGALALAALGGPEAAGALLRVCLGLGLCAGLLGLWAAKRREALGLPPSVGALAARAPFFACAFLLAALGLSLFLSRCEGEVLPPKQWAGKKEDVQALVLDYPEKRYSRYYYRLRVERIGGEPVKPFTLRLSAASPLYCEPYDRVEYPVTFYAFTEGGLYSQQNSLLADGYQLGGYLAGGGGTRIPCEGNPPGKALAVFRRRLSREFARLLPREDAALLQAMLLGRRDGLPEEAYESFRLAGCSHLMVVSGLHMAAVAGLITALLRKSRLKKLPRSLLTAGALLLYLCLIGFPPSAVRAYVMYAAYLLGGCLGRRADGLNSLGLALVPICLQSPFSGGDLGLALSVFATLGILVLAPGVTGAILRPLEKLPRLKRLFTPAAGVLGVTFSVMVGTAPWQICVFRGLSLLSPLANLLLSLPCTLLLYCALFILLFSLLPGLAPLAQPFAFSAGWLGRLARGIAGALGGLPGAYAHLGQAEMLALLGVLCLLAVLSFPHLRPVGRRAGAGVLLAFILGSYGLYLYGQQGFAVLAIQGEGENACAALVQDGRAAVLCPGGRAGDCVDLLRRNNVREVSSLFLPKGDSREMRSAGKILGAFPVGEVFLPQGAYGGRELAGKEAFLAPGGTYQALPEVEALYSPLGTCLGFTVNGAAFQAEFWEEGLRVHSLSGENSGFTVLLSGDIIEETAGSGLSPGTYLLPRREEGLRLAVSPQGEVTVREGS